MAVVIKALERSDHVFGGAAAWIALSLILATVLLLAPEDRTRAKGPTWLLVHYALLTLVLWFIPRGHPAEAALQLIAVALVLASIARSAFLLFVHSFWMRRVARPLPKILQDVIQGFIFAAALLLVLRSAGVEPGSLLATSALLTAVIGLSLQDTLGNLFAGLAIQAQRPFTVGDWVELDSQSGHIGRVIEINWRATRVQTLDLLEVTIPNGTVAKSSIINFSRPTETVRREVEVHAPYETSPELVRRVLLSSIDHVPLVLRQPAPQVVTRGFSDRGVTYLLRYFISRFQDREIIDSAVRERMWYGMQRAGLIMPVPRRHIEILETSVRVPDLGNTPSLEKLLLQIPLFQHLPKESSQQLAAHCRRRRYASEEVIVRRGDTSTEMYVIESGSVRIEVNDDEGRLHVVAHLGHGEFFGEMSLMTGEERTADVIANEETGVLVLDRDALVPLVEQYPELAEKMSQSLAERQLQLNQLSSSDAEEQRVSAHDELEILGRIRRFFAR